MEIPPEVNTFVGGYKSRYPKLLGLFCLECGKLMKLKIKTESSRHFNCETGSRKITEKAEAYYYCSGRFFPHFTLKYVCYDGVWVLIQPQLGTY